MANFSGGFSFISSSGKVISEQQEPEGYPWATFLVSQIKSSLEKNKSNFNDFSKIIFTKGPGSFTGIRIGIAFSKTLSRLLNIPAIGVTTLQAWASFAQPFAQQGNYNYIQVVIDSKRADLYTQKFCRFTLEPLEDVKSVYPQEIPLEENCYFVGDGVPFLSFQNNENSLSARFLPASTLEKFGNFFYQNPEDVFLPFYFNSPAKKIK
jgi:tRNA threonylcarbamoyladenosine biosynthesis protein TsaB